MEKQNLAISQRFRRQKSVEKRKLNDFIVRNRSRSPLSRLIHGSFWPFHSL